MNEIKEIFDHIDKGDSFLLSGGAGSGKTYTLVQVIKKLIEKKPSTLIACMTYTNAAVKEIEEKVSHSNLKVTTIHDFLWDNIKNFQKELKKCLVQLANDEEVKTVKRDSDELVPQDFFENLQDSENPENKIQYKEYLRISKGIISHDQVIAVSELMFQKFPKLGDIIKDKYEFIFIDEYQDTQEEVVKIFLDHFKLTAKRNIIGFFGDAMQSIYGKSIGNLDNYKGEKDGMVREVKKEQNRRNPSLVIDLANKIRTDGLKQVPSGDNRSPNMINGSVKIGKVKFLYSNDVDVDVVKDYLGWNFQNSRTKELNLTHNLIAKKANFHKLMSIYDKDEILNYVKRVKKYIEDNQLEKDLYEKMPFGEVIELLKANKSGSDLKNVEPTKTMNRFIGEHQELYDSALKINFQDISRIYVNKDQLLDDNKMDEDDINKKGSKRDGLIKHLYRLQDLIWLYQNSRYNEFLQKTDFRTQLYNVGQKRILRDNIETLIKVENKSIGEVIEEADKNRLCIKGDELKRFMLEKKYIFDRVKSVPFKEFQSLYEYLEGRTPFLTQHKTKGSEYDNVLVILDNGGWASFNFKYLFENTPKKDSVINRTRKLFYVCCTRSKKQLAVYYHDPSDQVINKAREWFGRENVVCLKEFGQ